MLFPLLEVEKKELKELFSVLKVDAVTPSADTIKNDIKKEFFKEHSQLKSILQVIFQLFFFFKKKIIIINI